MSQRKYVRMSEQSHMQLRLLAVTIDRSLPDVCEMLVDVEHIRINPGLRFVHHMYFRIAENIVFDKEKMRLEEGDIQYFIDQLIKQGAYRKRSILWALRFWHALRLPSRMANLLKRNARQRSIIQLFRLPSFLRFYAQ